MFADYFKNVFGVAYVREEDNFISIGGIETKKLLEDIQKIWGNIRLLQVMFSKMTRTSVTFERFFAVDVLYMFEQIALYKKRRSNKYRAEKVASLLRTETWLRSMFSEHESILDYDQLSKLKHTLYDHQIKALKVYDEKVPKMKLKGYLLAADVGTGKTIITLALATCLNAEVIICLCPKSLTNTVWVKGIKDEFGEDASIWCSDNEKSFIPGKKYYVVHYEYINKLLNEVNFFRDKKTCLIIDESHNLNDASSQRTMNFINFANLIGCQHNIFSSGTPVKALGSEMTPLLSVLDPMFNIEAKQRFEKVYGISAKRGVDVLRHRLDLIGHKIPKTVVMKIPPPIHHEERIKLKDGDKYTISSIREEMRRYIEERIKYYNANMKKYEEIYNNCIKIFSKSIKDKQTEKNFLLYTKYINDIRKGYDPSYHKEAVKFCNSFEKNKINPSLPPSIKREFQDARIVIKYVQLKVVGEALGNILVKRRIECHKNMLRQSNILNIVLESDKKTLCFSSFTDVLKEGYNYFEEQGFRPLIIYGEKSKEVNDIVNDFLTNNDANPLFASLKMMQVGVTLINCSSVILLDPPFRDYIREQAVHRIHRIGQDTQTHVYEFILDTGNNPNISTRAQDILEWSKQQVDAILGKNIGTDELVGIVEYLNLNPKTPFDKFVNRFKKLFSI